MFCRTGASGDTGCSEGTVGGVGGETGRGRGERWRNKSGSTAFWESILLCFLEAPRWRE